jgi:hypothetical protein
MEAIKQFTKDTIQLTVTAHAVEIQEKQDWLFWLSEESLTMEKISNNILFYEQGSVNNHLSWIRAANSISFSPVALYKSIASPGLLNESSETIWQDGFGIPILSRTKRGKTGYYSLFSRFNPTWNELVWSSSFPELIYALIEKEKIRPAPMDTSDKRIIDRSQMLPVFTAANEMRQQQVLLKITDLTGLSWLLVFLLFFIERLVSFRYYTQQENG